LADAELTPAGDDRLGGVRSRREHERGEEQGLRPTESRHGAPLICFFEPAFSAAFFSDGPSFICAR
jgi:hypothetical protein